MPPPDDIGFMKRALMLAGMSRGHTRPNPPVGAVVVKGAKIIGEGRHVRCGADHAEVAALKSAVRRRNQVKGSTVYVTLEPCSRPGRVGACCDALVAAGVRKVVWAVPDPNPKNAGRASRILGCAGIETECWSRSRDAGRRACAEAAKELIAPFAKHVATGLPFVTVKIAMSLDGRICDDSGDAKWISSEKARRTTGRLREIVDVIMVGAETVRKDNPSLLSHGRRNDDLYRAVVTRSGRLPPGSQIFTDAARDRTIVFKVGKDGLRGVLRQLGERSFMHILCEGGLELARSLAAEGLVDEWITVLAPKVIGHLPITSAVPVGKVLLLPDMPEAFPQALGRHRRELQTCAGQMRFT